MYVSKEQEANAMAYFSSLNKAREIETFNEAQQLKLQSTNSLIEFTKGLNMRMSEEYQNEVLRASGIDIMQAKDDIGMAISSASQAQGITGGASKGRIVQATALKASEALGAKIQATESVISKVANQAAKDNQMLDLQKQQAYNAMLANSISGPVAALQIQSAALEGYQEGLSIGTKRENIDAYNLKIQQDYTIRQENINKEFKAQAELDMLQKEQKAIDEANLQKERDNAINRLKNAEMAEQKQKKEAKNRLNNLRNK